MAFININNLTEIQNLNPGDFVLPTMTGVPNQLLANTPRLRRSIKAMKTTMQRRGLGTIAALIPETDDGLLPQRMSCLELAIIDAMRTYLRQPNEARLAEIFHMVQLWGGRAGRNIYLQGGGFDSNWKHAAYQEFVAASVTPDLGEKPDPRVLPLIEAARKMRQFGVAFATKHARFWAQAAIVKALPIYDRIMAHGSMGIEPKWNDYVRYVDEMAAHALQVTTDVATLERHAFNTFGTPAGQAWIAARMI